MDMAMRKGTPKDVIVFFWYSTYGSMVHKPAWVENKLVRAENKSSSPVSRSLYWQR